jgi:hypothetical protein
MIGLVNLSIDLTFLIIENIDVLYIYFGTYFFGLFNMSSGFFSGRGRACRGASSLFSYYFIILGVKLSPVLLGGVLISELILLWVAFRVDRELKVFTRTKESLT